MGGGTPWVSADAGAFAAAGAAGPFAIEAKCQQPEPFSSYPTIPLHVLQNNAGCETEGTLLLRDICTRLPDPTAIASLLDALGGSGNASISTFELLSSGAVHQLKAYLQGADLPADGRERQQALLQRLGEFAGAGGGRVGAVGGWGKVKRSLLLLHRCLYRCCCCTAVTIAAAAAPLLLLLLLLPAHCLRVLHFCTAKRGWSDEH